MALDRLPWVTESEALDWYRGLKGIERIAFDAWLMFNDKRLLRFVFWRLLLTVARHKYIA